MNYIGKGGFFMPENRGCGGGFGFGDDCCWIILLLLFTLFLMEDKPNVLLLDEPEISLHIEWQDKLVSMMNELNPNCQIIMTTHSPNIFADGWEDKLVFISDLVVTE